MKIRNKDIPLKIVIIAAIAFCFFMVAVVYLYFSYTLPQIFSIEDYQPKGVSEVVVMDKNEEKIVGEFYRERRYLVRFEEIPKVVINAFLSAEDATFFEHEGISPIAILRAAAANLREGQIVQGGSTITQQVAKSLFLTPERSFVRKFKDMILALRLEKYLTKEQILYLYLNQIYLGHGSYGIQAASRVYFDKDVKDLQIHEAALLAGMPRAPGKYGPLLNPTKAKERQRYVLRRMEELGHITHEEMIKLVSSPLRVYRYHQKRKPIGAYYVEHVRKYLVKKYGEDQVLDGAMKITIPTTWSHLKSSYESLRDGLREVDKRRGYRGALKNMATQEEVDLFLEEQNKELAKARIPYVYLLPDGRLDEIEAMKEVKVSTEQDFLIDGETYQAVVVDFDHASKSAKLKIGRVTLDLPSSHMAWALYAMGYRDLSSQAATPSRVLKKGDVVLVRAEKVKKKKEISWVAYLEQEPEVQGALFSVETNTGNVIAMEGGYDFHLSEFNRAVQAQRQPGSAFKPIIYTAAIEKGYTPSTIIVDSPIVFSDDEIGKWKPSNFSEKFYGDTSLHLSFIKSRNIPTIKLVQDIGIKKMIQFSKRLGLAGQINEDLSLSLGSFSTSLQELTQVYAIFPRGGKKARTVFIDKVLDRDRALLEEKVEFQTEFQEKNPDLMASAEASTPEATDEQKEEGKEDVLQSFPPPAGNPDVLLDKRVAYVMTHLMNDVVLYGTGQRAKALNRPSAGKTGTTNEFKDAWYMGFIPEVATGVWVGYDDPSLTLNGETGARAALPVWLEFMTDISDQYPVLDFPVPEGIKFASVHYQSGQLIDPENPDARNEAYIAGTEPVNKVTPSSAIESESEFLKESY